jgi:hypothetical protein
MGNLNHLHKKAHYEQPRANSVVYNVLNCGHLRSKSYIKRIIIQKIFQFNMFHQTSFCSIVVLVQLLQ